jgi:hypothetical protein
MAVVRPAEKPKEGLAKLMCTAEAGTRFAAILLDKALAGSFAVLKKPLASDD